MNKTYRLEQIKQAFYNNFHKSGEKWFNYLGSDEENNRSTEYEWKDFVHELDELQDEMYPRINEKEKITTPMVFNCHPYCSVCGTCHKSEDKCKEYKNV